MNRSRLSSGDRLLQKPRAALGKKKMSISIKPHYHALLKDFGNPAQLANHAVESYLVTRILKHIEECKEEIKKYESRYGNTYREFHDKIVDVKGKHPRFIVQLEKKNPTYEDDFITWGAMQRELEKWNAEMKRILAS
jgi:hypothetical protein